MNNIYEIILSNIHDIQLSYYAFRKDSVKKKKAKIKNFAINPILLHGVRFAKKFKVTNGKLYDDKSMADLISKLISNEKKT